jgi:hypothetical protein
MQVRSSKQIRVLHPALLCNFAYPLGILVLITFIHALLPTLRREDGDARRARMMLVMSPNIAAWRGLAWLGNCPW